MNSREDLAKIFRGNRRLAEINPDLAAEVLAPTTPQVTVHRPKNDYAAELVQQLGFVGIEVEPEFLFSRRRKFRADWRVVKHNVQNVKDKKILIEYEGGLFSEGKRGHSSISGILRDICKTNEAQLSGYTIIRVAPSHVRSGEALRWIEEALAKAASAPSIAD